ncbi:MAG: hypothetical protein LBU46_01815 [Candidatus Accumulibacter sp.]|nr:hypothetical protein [Accumulibacter sp.]
MLIESTVLITTALRPPDAMPFLEMKNVAARTIATKAAIFFWAAQGIKNLVIADATDSIVLNEEEIILLEQMNIDIEQIRYAQDTALVCKMGKGYAEGKLITFAIENSHLLARNESFFKCTGKILCRNFPAIEVLIKNNNLSGLFWKYVGSSNASAFDTRFFYVSKDFFREFLTMGYIMSSDSERKFVELTCAAILNESCFLGQATRPLLSGFEGGTNAQHGEAALGEPDHIPCWIRK